MKSGNLNFLKLSGPLQACNGTALLLPFTYMSLCGSRSQRKHWLWRLIHNDCSTFTMKTELLYFILRFVGFLVTMKSGLCKVSKVSKGLPQQAEVAQGVPGSLSPRIILTFRHYKDGRSSAKSTCRLYPRRNPSYSLSEAESTSGQRVLSGVSRTPPWIDPGTVRLVVQCLNP